MLSVLIWWFVLQIIGILALPITLKLLRFLPDRGVGFARQVGLLLAGYVFWLLVTLGVLQNTTSCVVFVLLLIGGASVVLWKREGGQFLEALRERKRVILVTEGLFLLALVAFAVFRAYNPNIAATEKPMEFGFLNAILRSRTFPPRDPWLSGYGISYYYFGYIISAMLTRLSGLPSDVTFNLTGVTLFALTVSGAFSLVYNMAQAYLNRQRGPDKPEGIVSRASLWAGLLGGLFVGLMGNLEGVFELIRARGWGTEALWRALDVKNLRATPPSPTWYPNDPWWWWRASRIIHDRDVTGRSVEVISEFPFFSFLLGDNHPHVLTLPFVLLALALAFNLLLSHPPKGEGEETEKVAEGGWAGRLWGVVQDLWEGGPFDWLLWGVLLGGLGFLNTWDYPIYLGIFVVAYAIRRQFRVRPGVTWFLDIVTFGVLLLVSGLALYFPFYLGFRSQAGGIGLVGAIKTRPHQYLLMFGFYVFMVVSFLVALLVRYGRASEERRFPLLAQILSGAMILLLLFCLIQGWWTAAMLFALAGVSAVLLIWGGQVHEEEGNHRFALARSTAFALLLIVVALLLTVSVEFVFLRDTFNSRMNTVFKFYYQGWVLFGIGSAYAVFYIVHRLRRSSGGALVGFILWSLVGVLLVGAGLSYTLAATVSKAGSFHGTPTLDGTQYVAQYHSYDYEAIQWLRANTKEDVVLVEAPGGSYSEYNWVSAHTGIPTVLGWGGHELQWRGNYDEPGKREGDIAALYQGLDIKQARALLDAYQIDYVYLGQLERNKYHLSAPMIFKFDRMMTRVFENDGVIIYARSR